MKKFFLLKVVLIFLLITGFSPIEVAAAAQEEEEPSRGQQEWMEQLKQRPPQMVLCHDITAEVLKGIKTKKKRIKEGAIIRVKSNDPAAVQRFRETLTACKENPQAPDQLLALKGIEMTVTDVPGGLEVKLTSENPQLVQLIQSVKIKAKGKKSKKS